MKKKPTSPLRHKESEDLVPLTDKLYTEFSIEILEERLETDPLLLTGLFNEIVPFVQHVKEEDLNVMTIARVVMVQDQHTTTLALVIQ